MTKRELRIMIMEEVLRVLEQKESTQKTLTEEQVDAMLKEQLDSLPRPSLITEAVVANAMEDIIKPTIEWANSQQANLKGKDYDSLRDRFSKDSKFFPVVNNQMQDNLAARIVSKTFAADMPNFEKTVKWNEADGHGSTYAKTIAPIANQMWKDLRDNVAKLAIAQANGDQATVQAVSKEMVKLYQVKEPLFQKIANKIKALADKGATATQGVEGATATQGVEV